MTLFRLLLAYQLELAIACLEAWEFALTRPRLEPEVDPVARARRCRASTGMFLSPLCTIP
jgi:hypothetical protein